MAKSRTYRCCACISPCTMIIESPGLLDVPDRCCIPSYEDERCKWERVIPPHECERCGYHKILYNRQTDRWEMDVAYTIEYCPFCGEKLEAD